MGYQKYKTHVEERDYLKFLILAKKRHKNEFYVHKAENGVYYTYTPEIAAIASDIKMQEHWQLIDGHWQRIIKKPIKK